MVKCLVLLCVSLGAFLFFFFFFLLWEFLLQSKKLLFENKNKG